MAMLPVRAVLQLLDQYLYPGPLSEDFQLTFVRHCPQVVVNLVDFKFFYR